MGEVVTSTGCRPVVVNKLNVGAYTDKMDGFNPYDIDEDENCIDEQEGDSTIYRRINPNLPSRRKACQHQNKLKVAKCPVSCNLECLPVGFNVVVTWDKTTESRGSSVLHLTKPLKDLIDTYDILKLKFFKNKKIEGKPADEFLNRDEAPIFVNSAGSSIKHLKLSHISKVMGLDVTSYTFRRLVTTWGLSHKSETVRKCEEEALQHTNKVAKISYQQNKQLKPQIFVQRYVTEGNLYPEAIKKSIETAKAACRSSIEQLDLQRKKKRYANLTERFADKKLYQRLIKPLGPRHRIRLSDQNEFKNLVQQSANQNIETVVNQKTPMKFRNWLVRLVCSAGGSPGHELRDTWVRIYRYDVYVLHRITFRIVLL